MEHYRSDGALKQPSTPWLTLRKVVLGIVAVLLIIDVAKIVYTVAHIVYHWDAIPHESDIFSTGQVWYTEDNLADHPVLNAVDDNPDHDELWFMEIYDVTPDENGVEPEAPESVSHHGFTPEVGHRYEVEIYCRNGADPSYNTDGYGFAEDVYVRVRLPHKFKDTTIARKSGDSHILYDYIWVDLAADNIYPVVASDLIRISSPETLRLQYVEGSAALYNSDNPDGRPLNPQWLFSPRGALIGTVMGGREYACTIKFRFDVSETHWYLWDVVIYNFQL